MSVKITTHSAKYLAEIIEKTCVTHDQAHDLAELIAVNLANAPGGGCDYDMAAEVAAERVARLQDVYDPEEIIRLNDVFKNLIHSNISGWL